MRTTELLRLVWLNVIQNKFKSVMTSIGIVVGAATIVMVIAIGRGGQMDVAEQFSNLNAGAIDVSYEWTDDSQSGMGNSMGGFSSFFSNIGNMFGGGFPGMSGRGSGSSDSSGSSGRDFSNFSGGGMPGMSGDSSSGGFSGGMPGMSGDSSSGGFGGEMPSMGGDSSGDFSGEMPSMGGDFSGEMPNMRGGNSEDGSGEMPSMPGGSSEDGNSEMPSMPGGSSEDGSGEMPSMSDDDTSNNVDANAENGSDREGGNFGDGSENGETEADGSESGVTDEAEDSRTSADEEETEAETSEADTRMNQEQIILTEEDVDDIATYVPGLSGVTISYTTRASVEGGNLSDAQTYTVAGVKENYAEISKLSLAAGSFVTEDDDMAKSRVCVLGASVAKEIFGSVEEAYDSTLYIDDRAYTVNGVLASSGMVSAGITADDGIFVPYETGIKYITGENISPTITVISEDINALDEVTANVEIVLAENYSNAEFTYSDAGSKMEAAESSNEILEVLLMAMAVIVFLIGGIGIMNVLFVSVRERTNEIGILKSLGASQSNILFEFLIEAAAISLLGGILGVALSFAVTPVVEYYGVRVEANMTAWVSALCFAVLTGTLFGIYPAWKASKLVPVEALNAE